MDAPGKSGKVAKLIAKPQNIGNIINSMRTNMATYIERVTSVRDKEIAGSHLDQYALLPQNSSESSADRFVCILFASIPGRSDNERNSVADHNAANLVIRCVRRAQSVPL